RAMPRRGRLDLAPRRALEHHDHLGLRRQRHRRLEHLERLQRNHQPALPAMRSLAALLLLVSSVAHAEPDSILRKGFTLRVGLGGGGAYFAPEQASTSQEPGIAVDFLVGGFVRPNLAIVYHQVMVDSQPFEDVFTP